MPALRSPAPERRGGANSGDYGNNQKNTHSRNGRELSGGCGMGGLVAKRAFLAPIVLVIATTAVPPASTTVQPLKQWAFETLSASTAIVSSLDQWLGKTVPRAPVAVAFQGDALSDGPQPVDGARDAGETSYAGLGSPVTPAEQAAIIANAIVSTLGEWIDKIPPAVVTASFQSAVLTDGPQAIGTASNAATDVPKPTEKTVYASLGSPVVPDAVIAPVVPELKSLSAEMPAEKSVTEKPIYASLGSPVTKTDIPTAATAPLPLEETKITRETAPEEAQPEEKQVHASLGSPVSVSDARATAEPLPLDQAAVSSELKPQEMRVEPKPIYASLGSSATVRDVGRRDSIEPPAAISSRPAVDNAPAERHASLGPSNVRSDALNGYVPPEKLRVAYDAPPVTERPKSIGKRQYVDDTNYSGLGSPEALLEALRHMGANAKALGLPASLWCADFMNMVLRRSGIEATGSRAARSYLKYGKKIDEPRVGAIAVFTRGKNGGHIGIVRGTDGAGNPIIVSGNHNNKVAEAVYPKSRVLAYVVPQDNSH